MTTILVTGAAGFIGYHLCENLLNQGFNVIGLDNINNYYDVNLKYHRLSKLGFEKSESQVFNNLLVSSIHSEKLKFVRMNLEDRDALPLLFSSHKIDIVCNLAAQAGVRYSIENPQAYIDSNINGFLNILECCRHSNIKKLVYASSSSVYGNSDEVPFSESDSVDNPISLYAASKKSNELMAHTYSHLYNIETIGLRFFTVYGPLGRPDMAYFLFTEAILNDRSIKVFNKGELSRDFTYIDDIIEGVTNTLIENSENTQLYKLYNIGNNKPVKLLDFIESIEIALDKVAEKEMVEMQAGDVNKTWADVSQLIKDYNFSPSTDLKTGVANFVNWYKTYYNI
jgi:UDP-glucuronate 4-epimerase